MPRREQVYILKLPKYVKIDDVNITSIPIDKSWRVHVEDHDRRVTDMSFGDVQRNFCRRYVKKEG